MEIVYCGAMDEQQSKGFHFPRLQPVDVPADVARDLCSPKPRVFFMVGEEIPDTVIEDRLKVCHTEAQHLKKHIRDYTILSAQYTDDKDVKKREGAEREIEWAQTRLEDLKDKQREIATTIHEDEAQIEYLNSLKPKANSQLAARVETQQAHLSAAQEENAKLGAQVAQLTDLVNRLLAAQQAAPVVAAPVFVPPPVGNTPPAPQGALGVEDTLPAPGDVEADENPGENPDDDFTVQETTPTNTRRRK